MIIQFEITDKSFELLKAIEKAGQAEFRDSEYQSLEEFKKSDEFVAEGDGMRTERWFKVRNFCDLQDLNDLIQRDLVEIHDMAWHMTYVVSDFGKEILKKYTQEA